MKLSKKLFVGVIVLALVVCLSVTAFANNEIKEVTAGETVKVTFEVDGVFGIDGYFEFSKPEMISEITFDKGTVTGEVSNDRAYLYTHGRDAIDIVIEATVTVSESAQVGDRCVITLNYEENDVAGTMGEWKEITNTIVIVAPQESSESSESSEVSVESSESAPESSEVSVDSSEPAPGSSEVSVESSQASSAAESSKSQTGDGSVSNVILIVIAAAALVLAAMIYIGKRNRAVD